MGRQNAALSVLQLKMSDQWSQTLQEAQASGKADDPTLATNFRAQVVEPAMQQWANGFSTKSGQAYANVRINEFRQHYYEKTAVDQAGMSAQAAVQQSQLEVNALAADSFAHPGNTDFNIGTAKNSIEATIAAHSGQAIDGAPNGVTWTPEQANSYRTEMTSRAQTALALMHFHGLAQQDPQSALEALKNKDPLTMYLTGEQQSSVNTYAMEQQRWADSQARQAAALARQQANDKTTYQVSQITDKFYGPNGQYVAPTPQDLDTLRKMHLPNETAEQSERIDTALKLANSSFEASNTGKSVEGDTPTYAAAYARLGDPKNPLTKVEVEKLQIAANLGGKGLSVFQAQTLREGIDHAAADPNVAKAQSRLNRYLEDNKGFITKSTMVNSDAQGDIQFGRLRVDAFAQYEKLVASGVPAGQAVDQLTDRTKPGSLEGQFRNYQTGSKEGMKGLMDTMSTATLPHEPKKGVLTPEQQAFIDSRKKAQ